MKLLKLVLSGEFLFALYLVAGSFKGALNIPLIDETLMLLIITLAFALKNIHANKWFVPKRFVIPMVLFTLIIALAIVSLTYTPSTVFAFEKIIRFGIIAAWCYYGVFFLFKNEDSIKRFLTAFVTLSIVMGISLIGDNMVTNVPFESAFGSSYVALARVTAMGSIILLMYFVFSNGGKIKKGMAMLTALILFIPMIQSGARLPIILFALVLLTVPFSMIIFKKNDILIRKKLIPLLLLFSIVVAAGSFYVNKGYAETLIFRLDVLTEQEGGGASLTGRTDRFETAWKMSKDTYFLGDGLGSFPIHYSGMDKQDYPHSIYLELLAELGIVPLLMFISLLLMAVINGYRYSKLYGLNVLNTSIYALFLFWLLNSFGSSSMVGDKVFYALIAIMIVLPYIGLKTREITAT